MCCREGQVQTENSELDKSMERLRMQVWACCWSSIRAPGVQCVSWAAGQRRSRHLPVNCCCPCSPLAPG